MLGERGGGTHQATRADAVGEHDPGDEEREEDAQDESAIDVPEDQDASEDETADCEPRAEDGVRRALQWNTSKDEYI